MNRNRLYLYVSAACLVGYAWLFYAFTNGGHGNTIAVCPFKLVLGIPCPSCGATRAVMALLEGNFLGSLQINPFGVLIASIMLLAPVWIIGDMLARKTTLFLFYRRIEILLRTKTIAIPCILLVAINWLWNIAKGL
jgi:hypothetical protein